MTKADAFFGDIPSFNQTLFDQVCVSSHRFSIHSLSAHVHRQLVDFSNHYGDGYYNLTVAAEYHYHLIQQSIAINPNFSFVSPPLFHGIR